MITTTLETTPADATHWSTRSLAAEFGLCRSRRSRGSGGRSAWQPHRQDTWKLSKDPLFIDKVRDVVGLYLDPPEAAVVLCVDEKTPDPGAGPHRAGPADAARHPGAGQPRLRPRTAPPACTPRWTSTTGKVIGSLHARHRAIEFKKFLASIDARSAGRARRARRARQRLDPQDTRDQTLAAAHPRFVLHFTPTSSSWLNLVERWFGELTTKKLRRGTHRSVRELNADIRAWIDTWNDNPRPYVWTKTADQILDSIGSYCTRINDSGH